MFNKITRKILRWKASHRLFSWPQYGEWVEQIKRDKSQFVHFTKKPFNCKTNHVKIFAYYLTQFHPIPENDAFHGKGFTEWTNVASALPHFVGHYQPKIPYDLGFYNLLMPGVMERQVEIAQAYGIYGFCFYYYWFSGKKVLEKPLEYWLAHKEIAFHYHFCWANENWSKLWDGGNKELILEQKLLEGDADRFFEDILPYLKDDRYEKIDNKPILMIYRPCLFNNKDYSIFIDKIQNLAVQNGFSGIYLLYSNYEKLNDVQHLGEYTNVEFPPHGLWGMCKEMISVPRLIPDANFIIYDMKDYISNKRYLDNDSDNVFKCCFPCWDNSPRKAWTRGACFELSDMDFYTWLSDIINWTIAHHPSNKQYVYINAWNEWGEGAILEPTLRYGYKYLEIVKNCLESSFAHIS